MPSSAMMNGPAGTMPSSDAGARPAFPQLALVPRPAATDRALRPRLALPAKPPVRIRLITPD